jgi:hypothetical protein
MSERTFRAVVAAVLVGALALAVVVAAAVLGPHSAEPSPSVSATASPVTTPTPSVPPTPVAGPVFAAPGVVSVGLVPRGASSGMTLVLRFLEPSDAAIPNGAGSFRVTLTDQAGDGSTVAFVGTPVVGAPGSLGATAALTAPNVLMVRIVASDTLNVEPITISGLGIKASSTAAVGPVHAVLSGFTGSLASGSANDSLASPGSVVSSP